MKKRRSASRRKPSPPRSAPAPAARLTRLAQFESWLGAHRRWVVLALVVGSTALRAVYFVQLSAGPAIALHRWNQTDMSYFDAWGRAIAGGDWLSASVGVPMHEWHHDVASRYFAAHADARAALEKEAALAGSNTTADALLWSNWTGGHQFYQEPLHQYLIGLTYKLFGPDPRLVFAWQLALGVASVLLVYLLARRVFGDLVAVLAGALAMLCAPLMSYELLLLRDSTITCAGLAITWLTMHAMARRSWWWFGLLGASLGLAVTLKNSFVLLAILLAAGIAIQIRDRRRLLLPAAALLAGTLAGMAPFAIRNVAVGVPPFALAGSGTTTFVAANDVGYPASGGFHVSSDQLARILGETDGRPLQAVVATLRDHTPSTLATIIWRRVAASWHWYEVPNNANFYYLRLRAPVLAWMPVTFFVLAPLGLVGLALGLTRSRLRESWPLYALVASSALTLAAFLVLGRLRLPLVASTIPFAALAVVDFLRARWPARGATAAAVLLLGLWTGRPLPGDQPLITLNDWLTPFLVEYGDEVKRGLDANDPARAAAAYIAFLRYEPDFAAMAEGRPVLPKPPDRETARVFAQIHQGCAELLRQAGNVSAAADQQDQARRLLALAGGIPPGG